MRFLKVSTAATITVGPFVDLADAVTPETGLTAGTVDEIGVYKAAGTALVDISGTTTFTHRAGGIYTVTLSTADTNTVGPMLLYIRDDSVCRPVAMEFMVLPANVYDSLVGGSDKLDVNTAEWLGTAVTLSTGNLPDVNVAEISDDATAADNLESYTDGTANMPVDATKISGSATSADNLESYTTGADNLQVHLVELSTSMDFSTMMKASLETAVTNVMDDAIPGSPTAGSINQRIKAIDELTEASGDGDLAAMHDAVITNGVQVDWDQILPPAGSITADSFGAAAKYSWASVANKITRTGTSVKVYDDDGSTVLITRTLDSASNPTQITP